MEFHFDEAVVVGAISFVGGILVDKFGGKAIPVLRHLVGLTPTKIDDALLDVGEAAIKAEAEASKKGSK